MKKYLLFFGCVLLAFSANAESVIVSDTSLSSDNEENVTKRFKEWIKHYTLVAHNAKFDKNMLDMAYFKYDLGELKNPIIDTLNLSRIINRDLKNIKSFI